MRWRNGRARSPSPPGIQGRSQPEPELQPAHIRPLRRRACRVFLALISKLRVAEGLIVLPFEFADETVGVIDLGERLAQGADIHCHGAIDGGIEAEIAAERLPVAVKDEANHFAVLAD